MITPSFRKRVNTAIGYRGQRVRYHILDFFARVVGIKYSHECPVCAQPVRAFLPFRSKRNCPFCGAHARHRLDWLFFQLKTDLFDGAPKKMLHFAPEPAFKDKWPQIPNLDYLSADLAEGRADVVVDITEIPYEDDTFDVIYCSHVLEHVLDDQKAMRELSRVMRPTGWAVLQVPITAERTFEDPTITDPQERERVFGQHDHVRRYGLDYVNRLEENGFRVTTYSAIDILGSEEQAERYAVTGRIVFFCQR